MDIAVDKLKALTCTSEEHLGLFDKLKALTCTSEEHLGLFLQFLIKMIQVMFMTKFKPSQFCLFV